MTTSTNPRTAQRLGHLFWIGLYWVLDAGWIWHDQIAYRDSVFDYRGVLSLHGCAPEQYRMAAVLAAQWISVHLGFHSLIAGCVAIDLVSALLLSMLLYLLLQRESDGAPVAVTLCAKALLGLLMLAYLHAAFYAPRVETLPNSVYILLDLLLIGNMQTLSRSAVLWGSGIVFVLLSWLQGWVRADVSVILGAALCLAVLFPTTQLGAGKRLGLFLTGAVAALLSGLSPALPDESHLP